MRQEKRHLVHGQRPFGREVQLVPGIEGRGLRRGLRDELVPAVEAGAPLRTHASGEHAEKEEAARDLPATLVAHGRAPPGVSGHAVPGVGDDLGGLANAFDGDSSLGGGGPLEGELRVGRAEEAREVLEVPRTGAGLPLGGLLSDALHGGVRGETGNGRQRVLPVDPVLHEGPVPLAALQQVVGHGEEHDGLGARPGRQPDVAPSGRVGEAWVEADELRPLPFAFHDPLRVRVEVMTALEVRAHEQRGARVRIVRARPVGAAPGAVAEASTGRTNVRMAVVTIDAPGGDGAVGEVVFAGPAHVVHDAVASPGSALAHAARNVRERFVPGDALPLALATLPDPFQRVEDALRVVGLVVRGRPLGAVAPARPRVLRVPFELPDLEGLPVHVGEEPARALAVEADGRYERVAAGDALRPRLGVVLDPIVPEVRRRVLGDASVGLLHDVELHGRAIGRAIAGRLHGRALRSASLLAGGRHGGPGGARRPGRSGGAAGSRACSSCS